VFPFKKVPILIETGLKEAEDAFSPSGDMKVLEHYRMAIYCLRQNIEDPAVHYMLLMVLTVTASTETPQVAPHTHAFSAAPKRKKPSQLALIMVTRMLWFLYPEVFPWTKGSGRAAYDVAEMTKKIGIEPPPPEHKPPPLPPALNTGYELMSPFVRTQGL
jgi:hypothetical protein